MAKKTRPRVTSADPVTAYAKDVLCGKVVAGPYVRNACARHLHDLEHALERGFEWNIVTDEERQRAKAAGETPETTVERAIGFFRRVLCLNAGDFEGRAFELHPSQAFIVGSLFGWTRKGDQRRRFRRAYIEIAKGNGKTPLAAGVGLYCLLADGEMRAEVYAAASNKMQAMTLFRDVVAMVDQSPALTQRLTKSGGNPVWNIADFRTSSFFRPISSEDGQSGPRPSCALCDEVHEHRDGIVIEMLERGFKWRSQPLLLMTTNAGTDRNSACWREHDHAIQVAAGTKTPDDTSGYVGDPDFVREPANDRSFSYVASLDLDDDPLKDPSCWVKANPLLGVTMTEEKLAEAVSQAKAIPGKLNGILRLNFCVWTDVEQAWMSRSTLEAVFADFDPREHVGKDLSGGLDLSASKDMTVLACIVQTGTIKVEREGRLTELPTYDAWVEAWTPKDTLAERSLRDQMPYEVWAKGGWLNAVAGPIIRLDYVAARIAELNSEYLIQLLAYDRYAYRKLEDEFDQLGLTLPQAAHPQGGVRRSKPTEDQIRSARDSGQEPPEGLWMPGSILALETLILEKRIRLRRSPVLMSAMMSAAVERDAFDNRWFSKRRAVNRIDALVALAMAVGAATAAPATFSSVYESRGLLVL